MCSHDNSSDFKVWRPDDTAQPTPRQPGSTQLFRPDILETIEAKIKEMDAELRELSLDIHGITDTSYYLFIRSSHLLLVAHPELAFEE